MTILLMTKRRLSNCCNLVFVMTLARTLQHSLWLVLPLLLCLSLLASWSVMQRSFRPPRVREPAFIVSKMYKESKQR